MAYGPRHKVDRQDAKDARKIGAWPGVFLAAWRFNRAPITNPATVRPQLAGLRFTRLPRQAKHRSGFLRPDAVPAATVCVASAAALVIVRLTIFRPSRFQLSRIASARHTRRRRVCLEVGACRIDRARFAEAARTRGACARNEAMHPEDPGCRPGANTGAPTGAPTVVGRRSWPGRRPIRAAGCNGRWWKARNVGRWWWAGLAPVVRGGRAGRWGWCGCPLSPTLGPLFAAQTSRAEEEARWHPLQRGTVAVGGAGAGGAWWVNTGPWRSRRFSRPQGLVRWQGARNDPLHPEDPLWRTGADVGAPSLVRFVTAIRAAGRNLPHWPAPEEAAWVRGANPRSDPLHPEDPRCQDGADGRRGWSVGRREDPRGCPGFAALALRHDSRLGSVVRTRATTPCTPRNNAGTPAIMKTAAAWQVTWAAARQNGTMRPRI